MFLQAATTTSFKIFDDYSRLVFEIRTIDLNYVKLLPEQAKASFGLILTKNADGEKTFSKHSPFAFFEVACGFFASGASPAIAASPPTTASLLVRYKPRSGRPGCSPVLFSLLTV